MNKRPKILLLLLPMLFGLVAGEARAAAPAPHIVVIYADDLGYGDVQCYNPERGKIPTPRIDRLAAQGMRFTDAHSSSGVCSPSRYTLLTGRYHWRTGQTGIVQLYGPPMIERDRMTVAKFLQQNGYRTAAIGKWHLGWEWPRAGKEVDFARPIAAGPTTRGFDSYFGTDVPNWPPYCFIANDRTVGIPSEPLPAQLLTNTLASLPGPALADWKLDAILPALADRACEFIAEASQQSEPFFLYMPLTSPHTPIAPSESWRGKSGKLGPYADLVRETDAVVGRVLDALDQAGVADHTLVLFTSDNGFAPYIGLKQLTDHGHYPSGPLRGYKGDAWEGGHRVPMIIRWPGTVAPGAVCNQLVHQADLIATCGDILGTPLPPKSAADSVSFLPLLRGADRPVRTHAVSQSALGALALRQGDWKLIFAPGGGGRWSHFSQTAAAPQNEPAVAGQLYHLADDLAETKNLFAQQPERVREMTALMETIRAADQNAPQVDRPPLFQCGGKQREK